MAAREIGELAYRVACSLVPPEDSDPRQVTWWRFKAFVSVMVLYAVLILHLSISHGWPVGPGFASDDRLTQIEVKMLERDILGTQDRYCQARVDRNTTAQRYALERRRRLEAEYLDLTGNSITVPSCVELGYNVG